MLFKVDFKLHLISFIIKTLELYPSLEEIMLVNIFIKLLDKQEKEHNVTWALKIIASLCQTVINKTLLMPLLMPLSVQVDKDVWP